MSMSQNELTDYSLIVALEWAEAQDQVLTRQKQIRQCSISLSECPREPLSDDEFERQLRRNDSYEAHVSSSSPASVVSSVYHTFDDTFHTPVSTQSGVASVPASKHHRRQRTKALIPIEPIREALSPNEQVTKEPNHFLVPIPDLKFF